MVFKRAGGEAGVIPAKLNLGNLFASQQNHAQRLRSPRATA
jgi:hypothetical protein